MKLAPHSQRHQYRQLLFGHRWIVLAGMFGAVLFFASIVISSAIAVEATLGKLPYSEIGSNSDLQAVVSSKERWIDQVRNRIRSNVTYPPDTPSNLTVEFSITQLPNGEILNVTLLKSSGYKVFDSAVERAIQKSSPLPKATNPSDFVRDIQIRYLSSEGSNEQLKPYIGVVIQDVTTELADAIGLKGNFGILVNSTAVGSPSSIAGLNRGDIVLKVGKQPISTSKQFMQLVANTSPGETIPMEIWRQGAIRMVSVVVAGRLARAASPPSPDTTIRNPTPVYPPESRRAAEQGKTTMRVFVDSLGLPQVVELNESSGFARLDEAAINAVRMWKFFPARNGDQPTDAWVIVPIVFRLDESQRPMTRDRVVIGE